MITTLCLAASLLNVPSRPGIQWIPDLATGLRLAKDLNKPILLMSAAPQCAEVPGDW